MNFDFNVSFSGTSGQIYYQNLVCHYQLLLVQKVAAFLIGTTYNDRLALLVVIQLSAADYSCSTFVNGSY